MCMYTDTLIQYTCIINLGYARIVMVDFGMDVWQRVCEAYAWTALQSLQREVMLHAGAIAATIQFSAKLKVRQQALKGW